MNDFNNRKSLAMNKYPGVLATLLTLSFISDVCKKLSETGVLSKVTLFDMIMNKNHQSIFKTAFGTINGTIRRK